MKAKENLINSINATESTSRKKEINLLSKKEMKKKMKLSSIDVRYSGRPFHRTQSRFSINYQMSTERIIVLQELHHINRLQIQKKLIQIAQLSSKITQKSTKNISC